jgi:competence protein ComEA
MARGSDHNLRFPELTKRRFDWQKWLTIAAIAIPLATGAFYLYKHIRAEMTPGEGDLIVNVNTATQDELETIPGIGPVLSRQVIAGRPYERIEDLERVRGIGPYTVNSIRPYVKVTGETEKR